MVYKIILNFLKVLKIKIIKDSKRVLLKLLYFHINTKHSAWLFIIVVLIHSLFLQENFLVFLQI